MYKHPTSLMFQSHFSFSSCSLSSCCWVSYFSFLPLFSVKNLKWDQICWIDLISIGLTWPAKKRRRFRWNVHSLNQQRLSQSIWSFYTSCLYLPRILNTGGCWEIYLLDEIPCLTNPVGLGLLFSPLCPQRGQQSATHNHPWSCYIHSLAKGQWHSGSSLSPNTGHVTFSLLKAILHILQVKVSSSPTRHNKDVSWHLSKPHQWLSSVSLFNIRLEQLNVASCILTMRREILERVKSKRNNQKNRI